MPILPANPKIVGSRPYTGNSDGAAAGPLPGMDEWIRQAIKYGGGAFWNNGSWGVRPMRGSESLSVHATGRAVDLSYRPSEKQPTANRKGAIAFLNIVIANANELGSTISLKHLGVAGVVIVRRGSRTANQRYTVRRVAIGCTLRYHQPLSSNLQALYNKRLKGYSPNCHTDALWS